MKIRRLEIQGFKSFADRTVLKFGDGVTGVVGPNGCGKSNIVDAIRWVMGEQSAKHLRGMGMQDVIFAGCEARGPAGMAEVSITFKNDGDLVPPEYAHHDEIQVTRRLFRDGTSEYAINQVKCRLRDILDLFMGTGIGKNAYAIIEQGRIGMIVTARPEERRALIEDAAGVSRYKARRKQAERRIVATEHNLVRVNDLVSELAGRLGSLEQQAATATRYTALKGELKALDLHAAAHERLELDARELHRTRETAALRAEVDEGSAALADREAEIAAKAADLDARDAALREEASAAHRLGSELELSRQNVEFLTQQDGKLAERLEEAESERSTLLEERASLEEERTEVEAVAHSLGAGAGEEVRLLEAREVALEALNEDIAEARGRIDRERAALSEHQEAIAERKGAIESLGRRRVDVDERALVAEAEARRARERASEHDDRVRGLEKELASSRQLEMELGETKADQERALDELRSAAAETDATLAETREALLDRRSRLRSLEKIRANYENCSDAVRAVMGREQEGLHGLVADLLAAEPRFETAVEAVLGERLQSVVVSEHQDGYAAARYLRDAGKGRSTFVPLDLRLDHAPWAPRTFESGGRAVSTTPPHERSPAVDAPATPSLAPGLASAPGPLRDAEPSTGAGARRSDISTPSASRAPLPTPTALPEPVEDPSAAPRPATDEAVTTKPPVAEAALTRIPPGSPAATDDVISGYGDWLEYEDGEWPDLDDAEVCGKMVDLVRAKPGYEAVAKALIGDVLVVESFDKAHELWVANGHRKTIVTLEGDVLDPMGLFTGGSSAGVSEGLLSQKREMDTLRDESRRLEAKVEQLETRRRDLRERIEKLETRLRNLSSEVQQGALSIVALERDIGSLRDRAARERELAEQAEQTSRQLREELASVESERAAAEAALDQLVETRTRSEEALAEAGVALEELERRSRDLAGEITTLKVGAAENREKRDSSRHSLARINRRLDDIETRLEALAQVVARSLSERTEAAERAADEWAKVERLEVEVERAMTALAEAREALDADRAELKTREAEVRTRREALSGMADRLRKADLELQQIRIGRENLAEQIRERYRVELDSLLHDYHTRPPLARKDRERAKSLRKQLSDIGPINLTAIEEYQAVKGRHDRLAGQKRDLEQAIEALRAAIDRINETSQERYLEAFRLVNDKFQQVFPKVFNGGRCALVMTDEDDPLESGIEIMAQPPGKKLQSVNLLSGGEKALTAVSLIFGIFLIKPTPFCLLDEVDAPLDEANVGRYNDMLREMSPISQFILITHNKRTMELPDRLYGVTMETPGISKIVPVDVVGGTESSRPRLHAV